MVQVQTKGEQRQLIVDGAQEEVLVSFVAALTHAGFSIASDGSPWRERMEILNWVAFGWVCWF